ncbi:dihydroxyacetone kinase phosphoryl donor subunit DhaM [Kribbella sp. NBC_01505]
MIGIVVVSHSHALATAAVGLASEMVADGKQPVIVVAAGLDETTFGTDAVAVSEAIAAADSADGVLVLVDLGSAVLSAELALEFLDPELAARVRLTSAPLVEGLVAAAVTASTGASLDAVATEAERGLLGKQEHLGADAAPESVSAVESGQSIEVVVSNKHGLHARPAARLVGLLHEFDARVTVTNVDTGHGPVDAGSLSMVATLNAIRGNLLRFAADGPEADAALAAVQDLATENFGDDEPARFPARLGAPVEGDNGGSGLDVAFGPAVLASGLVDVSGYVAGDNEPARLEAAVEAVAEELRRLRDASPDLAGIFEAQLALLTDRQLKEIREVLVRGASAVNVWQLVFDRLAQRFEELHDAYQRERAQDVRAVRDRVLRHLTDTTEDSPIQVETNQPAILVVPELDAATAAMLDGHRFAGVAVRAAGATGHGVIVARSRGIPLITGIGDVDVPAGAVVAFDARKGSFEIEPDVERVRATITEREAEQEQAAIEAELPAVTIDGRTVAVLVNVGTVQDALAVRGAEGSGLVRTELLFGDRRTAPTVAEQVEAFRAVAAALPGKPITIRTWDVGGDKPLPFLPQDEEANPFLGERGLRAFRRRPELLRDQLEAVRQIAAEIPVHVMFPMVTTADEVAWALDELGPRPEGLKVGIMVEVPAAALRVATLTADLDFVSIGTNDLTQYVTATDRTNPAVAALADGLDPAVLQLVDHVVRNAGVPVGVCGDLASNPQAAVILAALGVHELSAIAPQVPLVKARLREADLRLIDTAAVLAARDGDQVRALL